MTSRTQGSNLTVAPRITLRILYDHPISPSTFVHQPSRSLQAQVFIWIKIIINKIGYEIAENELSNHMTHTECSLGDNMKENITMQQDPLTIEGQVLKIYVNKLLRNS